MLRYYSAGNEITLFSPEISVFLELILTRKHLQNVSLWKRADSDSFVQTRTSDKIFTVVSIVVRPSQLNSCHPIPCFLLHPKGMSSDA